MLAQDAEALCSAVFPASKVEEAGMEGCFSLLWDLMDEAVVEPAGVAPQGVLSRSPDSALVPSIVLHRPQPSRTAWGFSSGVVGGWDVL